MDAHRIMTIATLRADGWPQATTVGYAHEGLTLYFLCGLESQKAKNLARDDRVSITIDHDEPQVMGSPACRWPGMQRASPTTRKRSVSWAC
jgi:nitroimidazol reductase NimA-like FMN-containing flavoprotein (pyridoxamine 5'-phosphate oxidase superfamily)